MKAVLTIILMLLSWIFAPACPAQGVVFRGKKLLKVVDWSQGGLSTATAKYTTILQAQLDGSRVVFLAYDGNSLEKAALFSADGTTVAPLLELGKSPLKNEVSLRLGKFRDGGLGVETSIPLILQTRNDPPRLALFTDGRLVEVIDGGSEVPGAPGQQFTQFTQVVGNGRAVAFIGEFGGGGRGVFLYSAGAIHALSDGSGPDFPVAGGSVGETLIFDGRSAIFSYGVDPVRDIYAATRDGVPSRIVSGIGQVDDRGTLRDYEAWDHFVGRDGDLSFFAKIKDDQGVFQWAFLKKTDARLSVLARAWSLPPVDGKSIFISSFSTPFFDGTSSYLARVGEVHGDFTEEEAPALLKILPGVPVVNVIDVESGNLAVVDGGTTPNRIWAEIGVAGPVEIPISPAPQAVALGASATFEVSAEGVEPFTYQWFLNGRLLPFATNPSLTLPSIGWDQVGSVSVVASNAIDSQEAFATLDLAVPPEITLAPADQRMVAGESARVFFRTRGRRPIRYELIAAPENSSFSLDSVQSGALFDLMSLKSPSVDFADSGSYLIRASNDAGSVDLSFNLFVNGVPGNSIYHGKEFRSLANHDDLAPESGFTFEGGAVFDETQDRFLTSRLTGSIDTFFAISKKGEVTNILENIASQGFANPGLVGFLPDEGIVFRETTQRGGSNALYARENGINSLLLSSQTLRERFNLDPAYVRFDFKILKGGIVGFVENEQSVGGHWAVLRIENGVTRTLVSDTTAPATANAATYLGCDDLLRPLFHVGFDANPVDPTAKGGPRLLRIENNGTLSVLSTGFLPEELRDGAEQLSAIPSHGGINYLAWGRHLVEIDGRRLLIHRLDQADDGRHLVLPQPGEAFATKYRVFFPAYALGEDFSDEEFDVLPPVVKATDSIERAIFAWSSDGIESVYRSRYLGGERVHEKGMAGGEVTEEILYALGDQILISSRVSPDDAGNSRTYLLLNGFQGERPGSFRWNRSRGRNFLDVPIGTGLMSAEDLAGPWTPLEVSSGSVDVPPGVGSSFFRLVPDPD